MVDTLQRLEREALCLLQGERERERERGEDSSAMDEACPNVSKRCRRSC